MGNENSLVDEGLVKNLEVLIGGHTLQVSTCLFYTVLADLVLRVAWLTTLDPHIYYYKTLALDFYLDNEFLEKSSIASFA